MINITGLKQDIQTQINNLTGSETVEDVLLLTTALENITDERFITVETYNDLPNLTTTAVLPGTVVFVKQFNVMMIATDTQWKGLDGRTYTPPSYVWGWGTNNVGQLGDNTTSSRSSPVTPVGGIVNWSQVAAGTEFSLGVTTTGLIYGWGKASYGVLANGGSIFVNVSSPKSIIGGITTWVDVAAGRRHVLGRTSAGVLYGWGFNGAGELGDGTTTEKSSPVTVVGGITNWTQMSCGQYHNLAITATGLLYTWGKGSYGRLGDGTTVNKSSPVTVLGGITNWSWASAGYAHSLAPTATGILYGWGYNQSFRIGDGTNTVRSSPVTIIGGITTWSKASAGYSSNLGLTTGGVLYAWGDNSAGQLGNNTTNFTSSPVTVVGGITNWSQIKMNTVSTNPYSIGITSAGLMYSWGRNFGLLGSQAITSSALSPVTVVGGLTGWTKVSAWAGHTIAIRAT